MKTNKEPNDKELGILQACAHTSDAVAATITMLRRSGRSDGWTLAKLARHNGPAYVAWRNASPKQKFTNIARSPSRFQFRGV
jgi:hypothetical protein